MASLARSNSSWDTGWRWMRDISSRMAATARGTFSFFVWAVARKRLRSREPVGKFVPTEYASPSSLHDAAAEAAPSEDEIHQFDGVPVGIESVDAEVAEGQARLGETLGDDVHGPLEVRSHLRHRRQVDGIRRPVAQERLDLRRHLLSGEVADNCQQHVVRVEEAPVVRPEIVRLDGLHLRGRQGTPQGVCLGVQLAGEFARQQLRGAVRQPPQVLDHAPLGRLERVGIEGWVANHLGEKLQGLVGVLGQGIQGQGDRLG